MPDELDTGEELEESQDADRTIPNLDADDDLSDIYDDPDEVHPGRPIE